MDRALFDAVGSSKANQGGVYIRDGKGILIIDKLEMEDKTGGSFFIAEFCVHESQKIPVTSAVTGQKLDIDPNTPGTSCSVVVPLKNPKVPSGPGNVKSFVLALLGYTEAEVDAQPGSFGKALAQLVDKDPTTGLPLQKKMEPGKGMAVAYETYRQKKKQTPTEELVKVRWTHVPPSGLNDPKLIAERRAKLVSRS